MLFKHLETGYLLGNNDSQKHSFFDDVVYFAEVKVRGRQTLKYTFDNGKKHNIYGPAICVFTQDGKLKSCLYYIDGKKTSEDDKRLMSNKIPLDFLEEAMKLADYDANLERHKAGEKESDQGEHSFIETPAASKNQ